MNLYERKNEIEARLANIAAQMDGPASDTDLDELYNEVRSLKAELKQIDEAAEKRRKLREAVASGGGAFVRSFGSPEGETVSGPDSPEYRTAWLKNLQGRELTAEERTAMTASAAIPTETMNMIVHRLELVPMLNAIDITFIPGNVTYPAEDTINAANWVEMATAATDSADTLKAITLAAYKLIKTVEITADVRAMAVPAFEAWLVSRLANKIQVALDSAVFTGDGSNKATGILHSGVITNTGTWTSTGMTYADLLKIIAALPTQYHPGAMFATTRAVFFGQILGMKTDGGDKVVVADAQATAKFNILGYPVIVDDNCAANTVIFGDMKAYKLNFASPIEVKSDESVAFRTGSTVYRAMCLADGKVADKNAFTVFTKGA